MQSINNMKDISHIVAGCHQMSARHYLPLRHDEVTKTVLKSHLKKFCPDKQITLSNDPEYIYIKNTHENTRGTFQYKLLPGYHITSHI